MKIYNFDLFRLIFLSYGSFLPLQCSYYIAKSLRVEDCFNKCSDVNTVDLIFEKHTSEKYYNKINYIENDIAISKIPDSIKHKINPLLICKLENN